MVSNCALAAVCVSSGLHAHILLESHSLANGIQSYVNQIKTRRDQEYALAREEGRSPGQYWLEIEPPKVSDGHQQRSIN
jgi:endoribonuclease Dicer